MYKPFEIKENLFYVGVNDRTKHLFENLWPLPKGVSYNSYIINDEKIALIDTVDICYADVFFNKIRSVLGDKQIDYLIVNHMEPDHSGSVELLKTRYPQIKIVGNSRTAEMLKGYYGITDNVVVIEDKEELFKNRLAQSSGTLEKPVVLRQLRKEIARLKTVLTEREMDGEK